jgi:hypothetical protein
MNGQMRRDYFCRSAALFLVFLSVLARPLIAQQAPQPIEAIYFDIPAQSLAGALDRYSTASGLMVMYDSGLAKDRRSTAVQGLLAPDVAISVLLEGTGLVAFNAGGAPQPTQQRDQKPERHSEEQPDYNPNSAFQIIGTGELSEKQLQKFSMSERSKLMDAKP